LAVFGRQGSAISCRTTVKVQRGEVVVLAAIADLSTSAAASLALSEAIEASIRERSSV